jgi:endonuclease/exonuclease/phosphatase family metal-dependent hydrolase
MNLSVLQLNINADNFWDKLSPFLTTHNFDIILLQEVCGKDTICGNLHSQRNCFQDLQELLANTYNGELAITERFTSSPTAYIGNAIFYKKTFQLQKKCILTLHKNEQPFSSEGKQFENAGRALIHLSLKKQDKELSVLTAHGAWAQTAKEHPHQTKQGELLLAYLKTLSHPFVFSGDLNLNPEQPIIQKINNLAHNLTQEYNITNTLNPRTHYAKQLFPKGIAVDYLFVSNDITVNAFTVLEEDLSDHFGLTAEIAI